MAKVQRIVERQVRMWEVGARVVQESGDAARGTPLPLAEGPWISVSRQLGSGGTELARTLAGRLEWQVYDREILTEIARHTHTKEKIISRLDEHAVGRFNDFINQLLVPDDLGQAGFLVELSRVIWALARQGKAILLGRGANWFLDPRFGLRVRVVAPVELRAARVAGQQQLAEAEAARRVQLHDAEQQAFIRQAFGRQIDDPLGYDLVLNSGHMELETAVDAVLTALRRKLGAAS